jgi:hypothetical protein
MEPRIEKMQQRGAEQHMHAHGPSAAAAQNAIPPQKAR